MAKTDFSMLRIYVTTTSATSAFHEISNYVTEFPEIVVEAMTELSHAAGDAWEETLYAGLRKINAFEFGGLYEDVAASGPNAIFGNASDVGAERVMKVNVGTTNAYPKFDFIVKSYKRSFSRGELTKYTVAVQPTGALSVATT